MLSQASRLKTETADSSFAISPANCPLRRPCRRLIKPRILPFAGGSATTAQTFSRSYPLGECDLLIQKREMNRANLPLAVVDVDHGQFIGATFVQIAVFIGLLSTIQLNGPSSSRCYGPLAVRTVQARISGCSSLGAALASSGAEHTDVTAPVCFLSSLIHK